MGLFGIIFGRLVHEMQILHLSGASLSIKQYEISEMIQKPVKITAIILIFFAVLALAIFFGISPLAKYEIEKKVLNGLAAK